MRLLVFTAATDEIVELHLQPASDRIFVSQILRFVVLTESFGALFWETYSLYWVCQWKNVVLLMPDVWA